MIFLTVYLLFISDSFGLIVAYFRMLVYLSSIYLYIFQCALIDFNNLSMVGSNGIEPSTSRLSGVRSNHLSYEPIYLEFRVFRNIL